VSQAPLDAMRGLRDVAAARSVAAALAPYGIPVLVLKGAPFQQRFLGGPAAYPSLDVDLLVPRRQAAAARDVLLRDGWTRPPENNALLWRLSEAVNLERDGVTVDLHWGAHAGPLPARALRAVTAALWRHATVSPDGLHEPRPEDLYVYLAAHAAGHGFADARWDAGLAAVARAVTDWDAVDRLAREARLCEAVAYARGARGGGAPAAVRDGVRGRVAQAFWTATRLRWVPLGMRDRLRRSRGG
jgi:hypothetical protein